MASCRLFQLRSMLFNQRLRSNHFTFSLPLLLVSSSSYRPLVLDHRPRFFSAISVGAIDNVTHPWPEWNQFLEKIRIKGYFEIYPTEAVDDEGEASSVATHHVLEENGSILDTNKLKNACLKFSRERFDILRLLSKEDIRPIVEYGCPNLFRKSVNSAKRLRALLRLDEADVCGACKLRESCDRAYKVVHEEDGARTVDIMRILLSYALNPAALLGGENPPVKIPVQESARKLLSEFTKLSDMAINPALSRPIINNPNQNERHAKSKSANGQDAEMKRGDWLCSNCNFLNFARNIRCLECKSDGPEKVDSSANVMKPGDWTCPKCTFMNFARNRKCFRCVEERPNRSVNPGDWGCPKCDFMNFSRNQVCRKCSHERPGEECSLLKDRVWRRKRDTTKTSDLKFGGSEEDEMSE